MKVKTITCHDVYNLGASLQAYALVSFLKDLGHDAEIIDYKPCYLSRHYSLTWVPNERYRKPLLREAYLLVKLPSRIKALKSQRKKNFDLFRSEYLPLTKRYESNESLKANCPDADVFIAGSDQIWNPVFENGKDPAFFLEFVPENKKKISYAASFAVDELSSCDIERIKPWLRKFDAVSVREKSGVNILNGLQINAEAVLDPVFLLEKSHWENLAVKSDKKGYILVYDFDKSPEILNIAKKLSEKTGKKIVTVFPMDIKSEVQSEMGPGEFLGALMNADFVISNSFHATAFSLIFGKEFFVVNRKEKINTRMRDLLISVDLEDRLISDFIEPNNIDWQKVSELLKPQIDKSKRFLNDNLI